MLENLTDSARVLDLESKQIRVIRPTPPHPGLQFPAWSADGKRLFLSAFPDGRGKLLEMDASSEVHLLLENADGWIGSPLSSPDGKHIAYINATLQSNVTLLENS